MELEAGVLGFLASRSAVIRLVAVLDDAERLLAQARTLPALCALCMLCRALLPTVHASAFLHLASSLSCQSLQRQAPTPSHANPCLWPRPCAFASAPKQISNLAQTAAGTLRGDVETLQAHVAGLQVGWDPRGLLPQQGDSQGGEERQRAWAGGAVWLTRGTGGSWGLQKGAMGGLFGNRGPMSVASSCALAASAPAPSHSPFPGRRRTWRPRWPSLTRCSRRCRSWRGMWWTRCVRQPSGTVCALALHRSQENQPHICMT